MTTVTITNPFSGSAIEWDTTALTQEQLDAYAEIIDGKTIDAVNADLAVNAVGLGYISTPAEWIVAYVSRVGADEAGLVILGS